MCLPSKAPQCLLDFKLFQKEFVVSLLMTSRAAYEVRHLAVGGREIDCIDELRQDPVAEISRDVFKAMYPRSAAPTSLRSHSCSSQALTRGGQDPSRAAFLE